VAAEDRYYAGFTVWILPRAVDSTQPQSDVASGVQSIEQHDVLFSAVLRDPVRGQRRGWAGFRGGQDLTRKMVDHIRLIADHDVGDLAGIDDIDDM
jgi:hypothetical protein